MRFKLILLSGLLALVPGCRIPAPQFPTPAEQAPTPYVMATCTVADCGVTLSVSFNGRIPEDYLLTAVTPEGQVMSVRCLNGMGQYPRDYFPRESYPVCTPTGVDFIKFAPDTVTLSLNWEEQRLSAQTFQPVYDTHYPNGPNCEPACRVGQIALTLPDP